MEHAAAGGRGRAGGVVWLVGASSGIGRALALRLAAAGQEVAITARRGEALEALAREAPGPGRLVPFPGDVTDAGAMKDVADAVEARLGPIEKALFNQGDYEPMGLEAFDPALFERLMRVNYLGMVHGLAAVMPAMIRRGRGEILLTASLAGYRGLPRAAPYGASKAAVINLAESLHPELAEKGVRLRVINPGFVRTPMTDKNRFHMPFLMETDAAVEAILRGLQGRGFEICFPRSFALLMKGLRLLPHGLFLRITRRMLKS
ncbi:MAG: SDR family NAD(P)-dependent oxidoreductase [Ectothiorhodospira sp.]